MLKNKISLLCLLALGCDRSGDELVPQPNPDFDPVIEIGKLNTITEAQLLELRSAGADGKEWCDASIDGTGNRNCFYGILGQAEVGIKGGAMLTFDGTGGDVCIIVDPETVFWNQAVAATDPEPRYSYPDVEEDDGDIDLFAGMSAYYTGSPGIDVGDFKGFYTDSLGNQIEIEYGECFQFGAQSGMNNAHAGRAAVEYCTINTANREGVEYTAVLESFSVPLDDAGLGFGVVLLEGACTDYSINECTIYGDSLVELRDGNKVRKDDDGFIEAEVRSCTLELERASCEGKLLEFCCLHPDMCGEDVSEEVCLPIATELETFCDNPDNSRYCCTE
jgi:hypothetical protein